MAVLDTNLMINKYFEDIAKIPHGSYHEEKIADYIEGIAMNYGLKYERDQMHNMIVFKDASKGYEKHETLMLQGHLDMVNEKNNDSDHDFENDPLDLYVEDGYLHARGTTLGADDGCGVCYMLAILTDNTLKHPPLECVFTVQEEVGLCGAMGIDTSSLNATRMIGLDSGHEGETCTTSSGGRDVVITKQIMGEDNQSSVYVLNVKGLLGGHSGSYIDKGRGNANKIVGRILYTLLQNGIDVRLIDITGGLKANAIPRECEAVFASENSYDDISAIVQECYRDIYKELEISDSGLEIILSQDECDVCICSKDSEAIITTMYLGLNGCIEKSQAIKDLTIASLNMAVIRTHDDYLTIHYSIRSPLESMRNELTNQLRTIAMLMNASVDVFNDYPGWDYDPNSKLRSQFKDFYYQYSQKELKETASHGGLETGIFKRKMKDLDIITMGPDMNDIHTPDERLNIASYVNTYQMLIQFLETL